MEITSRGRHPRERQRGKSGMWKAGKKQPGVFLGGVVGDDGWNSDWTGGGEAGMAAWLDLFQSPPGMSHVTSRGAGFRLDCDLTGPSPAPESNGQNPSTVFVVLQVLEVN